MGFVLDRPTFDRLIVHYETLRASKGMGTLLTRVTSAQRSDALALCTAVHAAGVVPAGDQRAFWLPYLQPVLAETREQASAFAEALRSLPETPNKAVISKPGKPGSSCAAQHKVRLKRYQVSHFTIAGYIAAILGLAVAAYFIEQSLNGRQLPEPPDITRPPIHGSNDKKPRPFQPPELDELEPNRDGGVRAARYRQMLHIVLAASDQHERQITPYALSAHLSAQTRELGEPSAILTRMLRAYPLAPLAPIPNSAFGAMALRRYAAQAAATRYSDAPAAFEPFLRDDARFADRGLAGRLTAFVESKPYKPLPAIAPGWETWPSWYALAPFLILLPGAIWAFRGRGALRRALVVDRLETARQDRQAKRHPETGDLGTRGTLYTTVGLPPLPDATRTARKLLKMRETRPGLRMDVARSLRATLASGGDLVTVMRPASRAIEFLFLVRRDQRHDHERARALRLLNSLSEAGIELAAYDYTGDPRHLTATARVAAEGVRRATRSLDLRGLRELHPEAVLVLMTGGEDLLDPLSGQPGAVFSVLKLWRHRMLLTPVPVAEWGHQELRLAAALDAPVGRATMAGLADLKLTLAPSPSRSGTGVTTDEEAARRLSEAIARITPDPTLDRPTALLNNARALVRDSAPPEPTLTAILIALRNWLGPGFLWLAACGVYPQLRFDLTLWLGTRLRRFGYPSNEPLFSEALLDQMCLLPWFRMGYMPDWLRVAAFATLNPREQTMARSAVEALLSGGNRSGTQPVGLPVWQADWRGEALTADSVMLDCVFGEPDKVEDPSTIQEAAAVDARRTWLQRALLRFAWLTAWAAIAAFLWPSPAAAPHAGGAWWPFLAFAIFSFVLAILALTPATFEYGRRLFFPAARRKAKQDGKRAVAKV